MKILLNAYACEPNRGSEPGVGWHWAVELAKDNSKDVHVVTRANNKDVIDSFWRVHQQPKNLHFHYYDLPMFWVWAKHHGLPINIYYEMWLVGAARYARKLHAKEHFDMAHHITFGVFRDVPPLYWLEIPYVIGPVGGGEYTPTSLMEVYSTFKGRFMEQLRHAVNWLSLFNPLYYKVYNRASLILTKTDETKKALCYKRFQQKSMTMLEIGIDKILANSGVQRKNNLFLFVGRFIFFKGIIITLQAFKNYHNRYDCSAKLVFVGKGYLKAQIEDFAKQEHLQDSITIIDWIAQKDLLQYYQSSTAMIFPSLHDSSGNVVLEALSTGLPTFTLDCGGPATILGENLKDLIIDVKYHHVPEVADDISERIHNLVSAPQKYDAVSKKCIARATELLWSKTVKNNYDIITKRLFTSQGVQE